MKYKMTDETKVVYGITLHRIQALEDNRNIKAGDLLGWIEKESNLSQEGWCVVFGDAEVYGDAEVRGNARVFGDAEVFGDARVFGNAGVSGNARVCGDAEVRENQDILWISSIGSRYDTTTFFKNQNGGISVSCGCFSGTLKEFEAAVAETHKNNCYAKDYQLAIQLAKLHIEGSELE